MGEGGCCFEFCELCVDNAGMPKLIKNYCSGAAGFAKRQKVLPKLLRVSVVFTELFCAIVGCAPFCCFFHSTHIVQLWKEFVITCWFFFRQALSDAPKSPYPDTKVFWLEAACWKESGWHLEVMIQKVATGSKMLHTIMSLQESEWECVKPWIHRSPENQVFKWAAHNQRTCHSAGGARIYLQIEGTHPTCRFLFMSSIWYGWKFESIVTDGAE